MSEEIGTTSGYDEQDFFDSTFDNGGTGEDEVISRRINLSGMYQDWFLDYASYVILERAVPDMADGLKPVQRRILHSMRRLDDGRFNKVANIIGHTMQFHPHGDASIGDALVQIGQKELLIDTQGNWGNINTGDDAAAPRYIEARLSKFALQVVFNPKITEWKLSYDGRNKEPVALPVKFPLLLAQGAEGIAVGLSSKILPHNFIELIDASIAYLQGKTFQLYPDFPGGGYIEVAKYNDGARSGSVRIRAKIENIDKKTLVIREIPYGKTTGSIIESILKANEKGKIKIRKIDDNTAEKVEIVIHLFPGVNPDKTIDALYAFTECEVPVSVNCCVIDNNKPVFTTISDVLQRSADHTLHLLQLELKIRLAELEEEWHFSSLERIFIEKRIYILIEDCETWEEIIQTIDNGLEPYKKLLHREVTKDDITKLTEIQIKRISKYDSRKADDKIRMIESEIEEVNNHLSNIVPFTINYFRQIKKKYGENKERKTEIRSFDTIKAAKVAAANVKLYVNREEGFFGTLLKKDEFVCDCSDLDEIIVFRKDGKFIITKVAEKVFAGKNILYINVYKRNDARTVYNVIYYDGKTGHTLMKRSSVTGITRDKEYSFIKEHKNSKILYFSANPNGEAEVVKIFLKPKPRLKNLVLEMDFSELAIKNKSSIGNILTKHAVHKIVMLEKGVSTLGGRKIWWDEYVARLNADGRGICLGEFGGSDMILIVTRSGSFRTSNFDLSNHFEDNVLLIEKFKQDKVFSAVYFDADVNYYYVKRFQFEISEKLQSFIGENNESRLIRITEVDYPRFELKFGGKNQERKSEIIEVAEFIGIKSFRAKGKRLTKFEVSLVNELEPIVKEEISPQESTESLSTSSIKTNGQMALDL